MKAANLRVMDHQSLVKVNFYYIISSIKVILVYYLILIIFESFTGHFANYGISICNYICHVSRSCGFIYYN
jgi:hypothetical protein